MKMLYPFRVIIYFIFLHIYGPGSVCLFVAVLLATKTSFHGERFGSNSATTMISYSSILSLKTSLVRFKRYVELNEHRFQLLAPPAV